MQCGYWEALVPTRDVATKQGQGNPGRGDILFHDQLTDTEKSDAHYFRIGDVSVTDNDSHNDNAIFPTIAAMRNEKLSSQTLQNA